ncbi:cell wall-binding protein [Secundilactobacillus kimchicus JCM 15530]|uniref:Cell wall-binding protein n=1 Tax=Secundilactobacillus kimchicus JCM 15530 TaxID=1302272 RepID=A0A0R1HLT6_9LACO|nr:C40 family peptidase [Secundilactobacillus kimchicus]KRK47742.1 cell wall-binding protein [Secundilactobacillus kimchicus JCM 15530]
MKHRIIWGSIAVLGIIGILAGGRALYDVTSRPNAVSELMTRVVPNHVYQTYRYPYQLKITDPEATVYSAPAGTWGARALGTVKTLNLATAIVGQTRKDLNGNRTLGYVQFSQHGRSYWISVQKTRYRDLAALKGTNPQVEAAVAAGLSLIGKAKYVYGGGRNLTDIQHRHYDCSSFVRHCYAQAGVDIGPLSGTTTYTLLNQGTAVPFKAMRRGDLLFFSIKHANDHVGMYLGNNLFIEAVPSTDTHGVGISTLNQPDWRRYVNGTVRRMVA